MRRRALLAGALVAVTAGALVVTDMGITGGKARADTDPLAYLQAQQVPSEVIDKKQLPDGQMQATIRLGPINLKPHHGGGHDDGGHEDGGHEAGGHEAEAGGHDDGGHPHPQGDVGVMHGPDEPMHGTMTVGLAAPIAMPCKDCFITGMKPEVVHTDGRRADHDTGVMLHHSVFAQLGAPDPTCAWTGIGLVGRRFFASGNERVSGELPKGYGVKFSGGLLGSGLGAGVGGEIELMNMSDETQSVYHDLKVTYVPASKPGMKEVIPVWLDQANCALSQFPVKKGRSDHRYEWRSSITGTVKRIGGHLHNGGETLKVSNATTGQKWCDMVAGYGTKPSSMGNLDYMPTCVEENIGKVKRGEVIRQQAHYHIKYDDPGAMAISVLFIAPN